MKLFKIGFALFLIGIVGYGYKQNSAFIHSLNTEKEKQGTHVNYLQEELDYYKKKTEGNGLIELCTSNEYYPTQFLYLEPTTCDDSICKDAYQQGKEDAYNSLKLNCEL